MKQKSFFKKHGDFALLGKHGTGLSFPPLLFRNGYFHMIVRMYLFVY